MVAFERGDRTATVGMREDRILVTFDTDFAAPSPRKSLDVTPSLNGIPVATVELKNPLTGQRVEDASLQVVAEVVEVLGGGT